MENNTDNKGTIKINVNDKDLIEKLSEYAHDEQWSGWMKYLFSKCYETACGTTCIPGWAVERWKRQINTPYSKLPEKEKESDRKEARGVLSKIQNYTDERI